MKKYLSVILTIAGLSLLYLIDALLGDSLYDRYGKSIIDFFGPYYDGVLIGAAIIICIGGAAFYLRSKESGKAVDNEAKSVEKSLFEKARAGQQEKFNQRSKAKLANRDFVDIEVSYTVEGSDTLAAGINRDVKEGEKEQDILKVFEASFGRLLIVGLPGAGKTTLVLDLAEQLLKKYEDQIPVVLDIATWQPRFNSIESWVIELLPDIGINEVLAKQLVDEKKLIPLFDGLDELSEENRAGFLTAVEKYGADSVNRFVITSRKAEYAATIDAAVEYQVKMEPFTLSQIRAALSKKFSPERAAIIARIDTDEYFRKAIETPFYLNAVQLLFSKKSLPQTLLFEADSLEGRQNEIKSAFVQNALHSFNDYPEKDTFRWLAFLADRMTRRSMVRFELVDMQYDWIHRGLLAISSANLVLVFAGIVSFFPLIIFIVLSLMFLLDKTLQELMFPLFVGMLFGIVVSFLTGPAQIERKDKLVWSIAGFVRALKKVWLIPAGFLIVSVGIGVKFEDGEIFFGETLTNVLWGGVVLYITLSLVEMIDSEVNLYLKINKPYQRFIGSMLSFHFSIIQHWHLCYLLRNRGLIPRRYPDFLQAATDQHILESDGGSWRFRHRILQEYFAEEWERNHADNYPDGWKANNQQSGKFKLNIPKLRK